jgi:translation elongation factor EF-G
VAALAAALRSALTAGFSLAMGTGPLAGEPVRGVGVIVEEVHVREAGGAHFSSGAFLQVVKEGVGAALGAGTLRLVEPFFSCELRCSGGRGGGGEALGKCYGVLSKRRGRVLAEDVLEGTDTWVISALLPVAEVYGFADELRKRTSGAATSPQLLFSHWEVIPEDPFFAPTTAAEREEFGDTLHAGQVRSREHGGEFARLRAQPPSSGSLLPLTNHAHPSSRRGRTSRVFSWKRCAQEKGSPSQKNSWQTRRNSAQGSGEAKRPASEEGSVVALT